MVSLLLSKGADVNVQDKLGRTPAMMAAELGNDTILGFLIENKADLALQDKEGQGKKMKRYLFISHLNSKLGATLF